MIAWAPALKAVFPYLAQIVSAAIPAFTQKTNPAQTDEITRKQIAELQEAATQNAETTKVLAQQMQQVINNIETGSTKIEEEIKLVKRLAVAAIVVSSLAIVLSLVVWLIKS